MTFLGLHLRLHPEGWPFLGLAVILTLLLFLLDSFLGVLGVVLTLWCGYFFRHPERFPPLDPELIVAPADGVVQLIQEGVSIPSECTPYPHIKWNRVSIFLNIFDVHVNRMPCASTVQEAHYHPGKFLNASLDKASDENERQTLVLKRQDGLLLVCVQIAGLIARRIVCHAREGQVFDQGQTYGIIRFGSRVDLYLPSHVSLLVRPGQRMIGGETVMARAPFAASKGEG